MKATQQLHDLGQRLWLDSITRELLDNARHRHYMDELAVTVPATLIQIGCQEESR
jgi:transaldolase